MSRKPRADAVLKTLPADQQEQIFMRLQKPKDGTYQKVKSWLFQEWDINTSVGALQDFYSWYALRRRLEQTENITQDLVELLQGAEFGLDAQKVRELGNLIFITQATKENDTKAFVALAKLLLEQRKLDVSERRLKLLEQKAAAADEAEKVTRSEDLTAEEKMRKLKEIFGA